MSEKMNFFCILSQIGEENRRFGALPPILITFGSDVRIYASDSFLGSVLGG